MRCKLVWLPRCPAWSLGASEALAGADLSADECVSELVDRFGKFCSDLEKKPQEKAKKPLRYGKKSAAIQDQILLLTAKLRKRLWLAGAGWTLFFVTFSGLFFGLGR